jgi:carbon-monoxide dehydrogenase medium subunit
VSENIMLENSGLHRPKTLREALDYLALNADAKPISGGASLVAMINARIVEPDALVSLAGIPELSGISPSASGGFVIGAFTRHREVAQESRLIGTLSVLTDAAGQIANATVRNMGTIGGAVAHADPGLDFPPALVAAGALIEIASLSGNRTVQAEDFFVDWYTTALEPGELVVAVHLPKPEPGVGRYLKLARVVGDFAIASVAISMSRNGRIRVAVGGCGPAPIASQEVNEMLSNDTTTDGVSRAGALLSALADPIDDVRGSAEYRRILIPRMLCQAVKEAKQAMEKLT